MTIIYVYIILRRGNHKVYYIQHVLYEDINYGVHIDNVYIQERLFHGEC